MTPEIVALDGFASRYFPGVNLARDLAEFDPVSITSMTGLNAWPKRLDWWIDRQLPDGPFVPVGFSAGATAAARLAERNANCVGLVFISGLEFRPKRQARQGYRAGPGVPYFDRRWRIVATSDECPDFPITHDGYDTLDQAADAMSDIDTEDGWDGWSFKLKEAEPSRWQGFPALCLSTAGELAKLDNGTAATFKRLSSVGANVDYREAPNPNTHRRPHLAGVGHHLPAIRDWVGRHFNHGGEA